jgi:hypothetical protein
MSYVIGHSLQWLLGQNKLKSIRTVYKYVTFDLLLPLDFIFVCANRRHTHKTIKKRGGAQAKSCKIKADQNQYNGSHVMTKHSIKPLLFNYLENRVEKVCWVRNEFVFLYNVCWKYKTNESLFSRHAASTGALSAVSLRNKTKKHTSVWQ